jgi:hypothetical protein
MTQLHAAGIRVQAIVLFAIASTLFLFNDNVIALHNVHLVTNPLVVVLTMLGLSALPVHALAFGVDLVAALFSVIKIMRCISTGVCGMIHIKVIGWTVQALLVAISTMQLLSVYAASHTLPRRDVRVRQSMCFSMTLLSCIVLVQHSVWLGVTHIIVSGLGIVAGPSTPALLPIVALTIILNIVTIIIDDSQVVLQAFIISMYALVLALELLRDNPKTPDKED